MIDVTGIDQARFGTSLDLWFRLGSWLEIKIFRLLILLELGLSDKKLETCPSQPDMSVFFLL